MSIFHKCAKCGEIRLPLVPIDNFIDAKGYENMTILCPSCCKIFIEKLAEWKAIDLKEEFDFWLK